MLVQNRRSLPLALLAVGFFATLSAFSIIQSRGPAPADEPNAFSAVRAKKLLDTLITDAPHPVGSEENGRVRDRIVTQLRSSGYAPHIQRKLICNANASCATVENIIAIKQGTTRDAVMVACHYDSVPAGPGAGDDGASVAVTLELARLIRNVPTRNSVIFLIDDGEEAGLFGAEAFARYHPLASDVRAVINLEARGTSGNSHMFETSDDHGWLIDILASNVSRPSASSLFYSIYKMLPNDTDLTVFKREHLEGVNFAFIGNPLRYHTPDDSRELFSPRSLQHQGQNAWEMLQGLVRHDLSLRGGGERSYFDLFNLVLVVWPAKWNGAMLAVLTLLLVVTAVIARRGAAAEESDGQPVRFSASMLLYLVTIGVSGGVAFLISTLISIRHGNDIATSHLAVAAVWLCSAAVVAAFASRHRSTDHVLFAQGITGILLGAVTLAKVPGAFYIGAALTASATVAILVRRLGRRTLVEGFACLFAVALPAAVLFPLAAAIVDALGISMLAGTAVFVTLVALGASAFVGHRAVARAAAVSAGIAGSAMFAIVMLRDPFTAHDGRPINVTAFHDADTKQTRWLLDQEPRGAMAKAASWSREPLTPYRGLRNAREYVHANAPALALAPPRVALVRRDGNGIVLRVTPRERFSRVTLVLEGIPRVAAMRVGGEPVPPLSRRYSQIVADGVARLTMRSLPAEGIEVELQFEQPAPVRGVVYETTFGIANKTITRTRATSETPIQDGDVTVVAKNFAF